MSVSTFTTGDNFFTGAKAKKLLGVAKFVTDKFPDFGPTTPAESCICVNLYHTRYLFTGAKTKKLCVAEFCNR